MKFLNQLTLFARAIVIFPELQTWSRQLFGKRWTRFQGTLFAVAIIALLMVGCGSAADEPESSIESAPTESVELQESLDPNVVRVEISRDTDERKDLGQLDLTFPPVMQAETNATVAVNINLLELATEFQDVNKQDRIKVSVENSIEAIENEEIVSYAAQIYVSPKMGARLRSSSFQTIVPNEIVFKDINYANPNDETFWTWDILAPPDVGDQKFTIELFLDGDSENNPSWTRSVSVAVVSVPTEPEPQPSSFSPGVLGGAVVLIALLGAAAWYVMNNRRENDNGGPDLTINRKNVKFGDNADEIQDILIDTFNQDELRNLCDDFGLRFEDLGDTITVQTIKLVDFFARRNQLDELLDYIKEERPNVELPFKDENESSAND